MTTQQILQGVHDWTNGKIVYDISAAHPYEQGKPTPYADLASALGAGGANIPEGLRKGGMSVKFIQGTVQTSDNKYVQYRLLTTSFSTVTSDWISVEDELNKEIRAVGFYENTVNVISGSAYSNTIYGDFRAGDVVVCDLLADITEITDDFKIIDDSSAVVGSGKAGRTITITLQRDTEYLNVMRLVPTASGPLTFRIHYGSFQDFIDEKFNNKSEIYERILSSSYSISGTTVSNKIINAAGEPQNANGFSYNVYSISDATKRYYFETGLTAAEVVIVHYYSNGTHIGGEGLSTSEKSSYSGYLSIPEGTDEIRINRNNIDIALLCDTELFDGSLIDLMNNLPNINKFFAKITNVTPTTTVDKHYIASATNNAGASVSFSSASYKIYDIDGLDKIQIHCKKSGVNGVAIWATYSALVSGDVSHDTVKRCIGGNSSTLDKEYDEELTLQPDEKYIAICNITADWNEEDGISYNSGEQYTPSLQEINEKLEGLEGLPQEVEELSQEVDAVSKNANNIVVMGDSITWLGGVNCDDADGWTKWFSDKLKPKSIKSYAWSGATWTNTSNTVATDVELNSLNDNNTIWQQIRRLIADVTNEVQVAPDVVIIAAGVNDVIAKHYAAVGESSPSDHRPNLLDKTAAQAFSDQSVYITSASVQTIVTLADSVRYGCEMLIQAFPSVQIILMTPLQTSLLTFATTYGDNQITLDSVRQVIKDCAAYLSANVIEQDKMCGVYYTQEKVGHYNLYDGLHTSETGAKKIGSIVASIVKAMIV